MRWVLKWLKGRRVRGREFAYGDKEMQKRISSWGMAITGLLSSNLQNSILRGEKSREPNACCGVTKMFYRQFP